MSRYPTVETQLSPKWGKFNPFLSTGTNPYNLSNNEGTYSMDGVESDSTYLTDGSNRVMLIADRSGNSDTNGLVLNGVSGNYASAPNVPLTGNVEFIVRMTYNANVTGNSEIIGDRSGTTGAATLRFGTANAFVFLWFESGVAKTANSDAHGIADGATVWVKATRENNSGGVFVVSFYKSTDGQNWTLISSTNGAAVASPTATTNPILVGGNTQCLLANVFVAKAYNNGSLVFDADFTAQARLVGSFTESSSNVATVTINSSGDTGARISGARDLVQLTTTKMPAFSTVSGKNIATFDGSNDYMSAPTAFFRDAAGGSVYAVSSRASETGVEGDVVRVETAAGTARLALAYRIFTTSNTGIGGGGRRLDADTFEAIGSANYTSSRIVSSVVADWGAARLFLRQNSGATVVDSSFQTAGSTSATGGVLVIGASSAGAVPLNGTITELLIRSVADSEALNLRINTFLMRQWNIS